MVSSPLEQFHLLPVIPMRFSFLDFTLSQSTIMMLIGIFAFISLLRIILLDKGGYIVPNRWQVFVETNVFVYFPPGQILQMSVDKVPSLNSPASQPNLQVFVKTLHTSPDTELQTVEPQKQETEFAADPSEIIHASTHELSGLF